jgi:hypothetical protein
MRSIILFLLAALLFPVVIVVAVNELSPQPVTALSAEKCTRYCHNFACKHKPEKSAFNFLYDSTIYQLGKNPFGLGYKQINILVFVILWPGFMLFLLIITLINHRILKRLKHKFKNL